MRLEWHLLSANKPCRQSTAVPLLESTSRLRDRLKASAYFPGNQMAAMSICGKDRHAISEMELY